ncbi:MAG TPA: hypothetical protein VK191_00890 [Symbiobacteriaceae bacterium]|nr:hypothetical protein [Symbiobacteriaceae bacterium]
MDQERRNALLTLGAGLLAGLGLALAKKGITGPAKLVAKLPRPGAPATNYGYQETEIS